MTTRSMSGLIALLPSPSNDGDAILRADVERTDERLTLRWVLAEGATPSVIPPPGPAPQRTDRLWEHTCFEVFLAPAGGVAYWELNVAPNGDWNVYRFDRYRDGMRPEPRATPPRLHLERASCGTLTVRVSVDLAPIAELTSTALDVSLAAVLEADGGGLTYWALVHAAARPDFHRRESFVVRLPAEERS
jgi:hypothetical protein